MSPQAEYPINIQQLRQTLKLKWLTYYQQNYHWLEKMQIWGDYNGDRRPLSGFILATVAVLEPNLSQILPFIAELNSNPDQVVAALGLDFNPDLHLDLLVKDNSAEKKSMDGMENPGNIQSPSTQKTNDNENGNGYTSKTRVFSSPVDNHHHNGNGSNGHLSSKLSKSVSLPDLHQYPQENSLIFKQSFPPTNTIVETNSHESVANEVNQSSILNPRNLANWIDDFCQGTDWNEDEAIFIPF